MTAQPPPPPVPGLAEASAGIAAGRLSPVALTEAALARIAALEPRLHAFITLTADRARAAAAEAERAIRAGRRRGPLHGIPYALKDIYDVAGVPTTAHSRVLADNIPAADSHATARLEEAGHGAARQAGDARIRPRRTHGRARLAGREEPVEPRPLRRRLLLRLRRRRRLRHGGAGHGQRHRRLHPPARGVLRHRRAEADLRAHQPARHRAALLRPRPRRPADPHRRGLRDGDGGAGGPRPGRPRLRPRAAGGLPLRAAVRGEGPHDRLRPRLQRGGRDRRGSAGGAGGGGAGAALPRRHGGGGRVAAHAALRGRLLDDHPRRILRHPPGAPAPDAGAVRARDARAPDARRLRHRPALRPGAAPAQRAHARGGRGAGAAATPSSARRPRAPRRRSPSWTKARGASSSRSPRPSTSPAIRRSACPAGFGAAGLPLSVQFVARAFDEATALRVAHAFEQATEWHTRRPPDHWH